MTLNFWYHSEFKTFRRPLFHKQETGWALFYKDSILTGLLAILRIGKCKHRHYSKVYQQKISCKKYKGLYFLPIINEIEKPFSRLKVTRNVTWLKKTTIDHNSWIFLFCYWRLLIVAVRVLRGGYKIRYCKVASSNTCY